MAAPVDELAQRLQELPFRRYVDVLRTVVGDLVRKVDTSAAYDQYPGKRKPRVFSLWYGPFGFRTPRRDLNAQGYLALAQLASPSVPLLPRTTNLLTGRDLAFHWNSVDVYGAYTLTFSTDPGLPAVTPPVVIPVNPLDPGDIFDSVLERNGGAVMLQNFSNALNPIVAGPATGLITPVDGASLIDGETFTVADGVNPPVTFEFDDNGVVVPGNVAVPFTAADTVDVVSASIIAAINGVGAGLLVKALPNTGLPFFRVPLVNETVAPAGNIAIVETVADPAFVVSGMAGGGVRSFVSSVPHISFDFELYDKKRGRSLTGGRIPGEMLAAGAYEFKKLFGDRDVRFDVDSEIEPRVYINEVRMTGAQDWSAQAFNASQLRCYLNIVLKGSEAQQEKD